MNHHWHTWAILPTLYILSICRLFSTTPYEPEQPSGILEKWRWHELEPLRTHLLICGVEAEDGHLWFASDKGLISYDGYKTYTHPYPKELASTLPYYIHSTNNGIRYVFTSKGIFSYQNGTWKERLTYKSQGRNTGHHVAKSSNGIEIISTPIGVYRLTDDRFEKVKEIWETPLDVAFDASNRLWLNQPGNETIVMYQFGEDGIKKPVERKRYTLPTRKNSDPRLIATPSSNEIWTISWNRETPPYHYNEIEDTWLPVDHASLSGNNYHIKGDRIDRDNMLIFSKSNVAILQKRQWSTIDYPEFKIPSSMPFTILRKNGDLVIGGQGEPIYQIDLSSEKWQTIQGLHFQCETSDSRRWFISVKGEIVAHNPGNNTWSKHFHNIIDTPLSIIRSRDDFIWVSGSHQGTPALSYFDGKQWTMNQHPELRAFIGHLSAKQLSNDDILFASGGESPFTEKGGIIRYRKIEGSYEFEYIGTNKVPSRIAGIAEDSDNRLWFGGFQLTSNPDIDNQPSKQNAQFQSTLWIDHLTEDNSSSIWVGVWNKGLFQLKENSWIQYKAPYATPSNQIVYILADKVRKESVWVATNRGISRFDGDNWMPNAMPPEVRLNRESGTLTQSNDGALWVNSATRYWYFRLTREAPITPRLYNEFKTIRYLIDNAPPTVQLETPSGELTSPANILLRWKGIDKWSNTPEGELKYSFRLNGDKWSQFESRKDTTLLELPQGHHTFEVRSMDSDGNISVAAKSPITIVPPIWLRTWFILLAIALLAAIIVLVWLLFRQRIRHIIELDEFKLQFFTNLSHELRTPLTVIIEPLKSEIRQLPKEVNRSPFQIALKNAQKLSLLIDQILDFRSTELGTTKLNNSCFDLFSKLKETAQLIEPLAKQKNQILQINLPETPCKVLFDSMKLEKIATNLLSNAIKYTQEEGIISLSTHFIEEQEQTILQLIVEDNGQGIPQNGIQDIFKVNYRIANQLNKNIRGHGIGLAYTKTMVEALSGTIKAESPITSVNGKQQGSRFVIALPINRAAIEETNSDTSISTDTTKTEPLIDDKRPLILIAEDDPDIRSFLKKELEINYKIAIASNGEQALELTTSQVPDLVLTDVMMPKMDGKELCQHIKQNESSSHIPVIMLTALKSHGHELSGLETGADDYLTKPISVDILKQRIHNQLETKTRQQRQYQDNTRALNTIPSNATNNSVDEKFIQKASLIVNEHIQNELFDVEYFAKSLNMSRMTLYRKLKAVTGESPSQFIRALRLNKAAELIASGSHNVTEAALEVGFSELSYFSQLFKKRFKISPSKYMSDTRPPKAME